MSIKSVPAPKYHPSSPYVYLDDIAHDAVALFTGQRQGHMGQWEYGPSLFIGDPAGGGDYWADLVRHPGRYYLTDKDTEAISSAIGQDDFLKVINDIESVVELGP